MSAARDEILRRVRDALQDRAETEADVPPMAREYLQRSDASLWELTKLFAERVADYKAAVRRVPHDKLRDAIAESLESRGIERIVVPPDVPAEWIPVGVEPLPDDGLSNDRISECNSVLTGCALAIAQTGTLVLDGGERQGRRAITLLPDYHLCVVFESRITGIVPEAIARLESSVREFGNPITFISGPSATSDIELNRVEGVHGPRTLEVLIVGGEAFAHGSNKE